LALPVTVDSAMGSWKVGAWEKTGGSPPLARPRTATVNTVRWSQHRP